MAVIAEKYRAYIESKGAQLGRDCRARVDCREEGEIYVPDRVEVTGDLAQEEQEQLVREIQSDLDIPAQRQEYIREESP